MVLKCGPSSRRVRSSSQDKKVRRGGCWFIVSPWSVLAGVDGDRPAERGDRPPGELMVGDLVEGELLLRRDVADVDVVLMRPLGALAHEAGIDRKHAVLGEHVEGERNRLGRLLGSSGDRRVP